MCRSRRSSARGFTRRRVDLPLNMLVTVKPREIDELTPEDRCEEWLRVRNKLRIYARQHEFAFAAVWARECRPDGTGEHLHVLMHVPASRRGHLEHILHRWFSGPDEIDIRSARNEVRRSASGKQLSAIGYVVKQMTPQAAFKRQLGRKAGGPIMGKRGGCTRNLVSPRS